MERVQIELLSELPDEVIRSILSAAVRRRWAKGEVLFHEGEPGESLHIVRSGHLVAQLLTADGTLTTLAVLGPGQVVGEMALARPDSRRTATVAAIDAAETWMLTHSAFRDLCARNTRVESALVALLAGRVDRLNRQVVDALHTDASHRVLRRLIEVAAAYGGLRARLVIPLTQQDLADLAGTTRPTVNEVLRRLEERGAVRLGRGKVEVVDPKAVEGAGELSS